MNTERANCYSNYYVPTIIFEGDFGLSAEQLMKSLDDQGMRNRPFFRPLSKLPMFSEAVTPVADHLAANGINLPCATKLEEQDVDRVCQHIIQQFSGTSSQRKIA
jgi:perosamine synthetase